MRQIKFRRSNNNLANLKTITPNELQNRPKVQQNFNRAPRPRPVSVGGGSNTLVDEIFDQTDVREALQAIASQANVSIIVDDQVAGTVNGTHTERTVRPGVEKSAFAVGTALSNCRW